MSKGTVSWQGIVKNIEFLGLDDSIKRVMGVWWRRWVKVAAGRKESERKQQKARTDERRSESVDAEGDTSMSEGGGNEDEAASADETEAADPASVAVARKAVLSAGTDGAGPPKGGESDVDGDVVGLLRAL